ncbi:IS66 family transposase (plasmid) [Eleftheria terrae]|nr:hypothetical protein [Eleftheria terrae]WKB55764.1 IS66 family transposase [Eleftheria terrae]
MNTEPEDKGPGRGRRRRHGAEFEADAVVACGHLGVSISAVAQSHGLNANSVRHRVEWRERGPGLPSGLPVAASANDVVAFVPLEIEQSSGITTSRSTCIEAPSCDAGLAGRRRERVLGSIARVAAAVRLEAIRLSVQLVDMRADCDTAQSARQRIRQDLARPLVESLHAWRVLHRQKVRDGSASATGIDDCLGPWTATPALPRRRHAAGGQQLGREPHTPHRARAHPLAPARQATRGPASGGHQELDPIGQDQ